MGANVLDEISGHPAHIIYLDERRAVCRTALRAPIALTDDVDHDALSATWNVDESTNLCAVLALMHLMAGYADRLCSHGTH